jgi:hypothetical protein
MAEIMDKHLKEISSRLISLAERGELSQSILLTGQDGIGKFKLVMLLTSALLCEKRSACGKCVSCKEVNNLQHPDFLLTFPFPKIGESRKNAVFSFSDPVSSDARYSDETKDEIDNYLSVRREDPFAIIDFDKKENIPVEVIKDLIFSLSKKPLMGGRRVAAILNVDKMAFGAADLFLKIVEEPPENTHIILSTANPDLLMPTLLSRAGVIKVPPALTDDLEKYLVKAMDAPRGEAAYLARMSQGSPGKAAYLSRSDITARRKIIFPYFEKLAGSDNLSMLIDEVNREYTESRLRFNEIRLDFEIMESLIHDLFILNKNRLDNHLINVDITGKLTTLKIPSIESLDVWKKYCGETKRACLVNNVSLNSAMVFFYISCAEALENPVMTRMKLP